MVGERERDMSSIVLSPTETKLAHLRRSAEVHAARAEELLERVEREVSMSEPRLRAAAEMEALMDEAYASQQRYFECCHEIRLMHEGAL